MYRRPKLRQTTGGSLPARLLRWPQLKPTGLHEFRGDSQSVESRLKIGQSLKGQRAGISPSEEHRKKISQTLTGRINGPLSTEHKALLSAIKKGFKHTDEAIAKMKESHKGKVLTAEHKAKISAGGKGIKKSEETKARMRKPKVKTECPNCGLPCAPHMLARHIAARHP